MRCRSRRRMACGVVVLGLACVLFSGWIERNARGPDTGVVQEAASLAWWEGDVLGAALSGDETSALPAGFTDEVVALGSSQDVRVAQEGNLVGFSLRGMADDVFERLSAELVGNGWWATESGLAGCGSFAKTTGCYRWAFVTCTQAGEWTSVVVQAATQSEGR